MTSDEQTMVARYQRARMLLEGMYTSKLVQNDILFPHWIGQSDCFWYERRSKSGKHYRLVDTKTLTNEPAFDHKALGRALAEAVGQEIDVEDIPLNNVEITLSPPQVLFTSFDRRWVFEQGATICREVDAVPENWVLSPDGKQAIFTREFNLWVRDLTSGKERALTEDGEEDLVYAIEGENYGHSTDPWGRRAQVRWSPDGCRIFAVLRDTRQVKVVPVVQHVPLDGSLRPTVANYKIALPGDSHIPEYHLLTIEVTTGTIQLAHYPTIPVLNNGRGYFNVGMGWWNTDSRRAYFVDQARNYKKIKIVEFDTDTGETRILLTETSTTHLNLAPSIFDHPAFLPLPETSELIWWSERSGWGHLYLYDLETGTLKHPITAGDWLVREVLQFDSERRELFVQTTGRVTNRDPYYRDLCRIQIDTGEITTIVSSDHDYFVASKKSTTVFYAKVYGVDVDTTAGVSPNSNFTIVTRSRADQVPVSLLFDRQGKELCEIEKADISALPDGWQWPEPVKLKAADGKTDIYGLVYRPSNFSPKQSYPILASGYHCPASAIVPKGSFSNQPIFGMFYFNEIAMAELGFVVIQIDGRGTPYRDKAFLDECYGWPLSASKMEDEVAGIRQLAERYPYMDLERVGGICPGGGPGSILGLLEHPNFYKVGVSTIHYDYRLCPSTMNADKFGEASGPDTTHQFPEDLVGNLKGKLLLMYGMLDTGNLPATAFRLVEALQRANKDFDMLLFPRGHHSASDYQMRRVWDYLVKHLLGAEPPKEFNLKTSVDLNEILLKTDGNTNKLLSNKI